MKKILLVLGIVAFTANTYAQMPTTTAKKVTTTAATSVKAAGAKALPSADQRAVQYSNELKSKLNLTPDQYTKVMAVNTECIKRKDAAKGTTGQAAVTASKAIAAYRQQQFQSILNAGQLAKLKAMNAQGGKAVVNKAVATPVKTMAH